MSLYKKLFGIFVTNLLHLSAGIIITNILIIVYHYPFHGSYYMASMLFAILPDFDILKPLILSFKKQHKIILDSSHKFNFMHYPLVTIPISFMIMIFFSSFWLLLITLNLLSHYIIDSAQSGSSGVGIQWLAPFYSYDFFRLSSPYKIKKEDINNYIMDVEEWIQKIVLNWEYPEFWINITLFIFSFLFTLFVYNIKSY